MDRHTVEATTYQMRNPFKQLRDALPTALDVFNYLHHHWIAKELAKPGNLVLDVCCGRGIMLPLLRYHAPKIAGYVGVDIEPGNAEWLTKRVTDGVPLASLRAPRTASPVGEPPPLICSVCGQPPWWSMPHENDPCPEEGCTGYLQIEHFTYTRETYYPFPTWFVESNAATMANEDAVPAALKLAGASGFDLIIYTQSIEHMHPDAGHASLEQCAKLAAPDARLILSGPNTPPGQDGYDARYRAHVYEWKQQELLDALEATGWRVQGQWGLTIGKRALEREVGFTELGAALAVIEQYVPSEWYLPVLAPLFPAGADEIAILATRDDQLTLT